jgi:hypothetical protein
MNSDSLRGEAMSNSKSRLKTTKGKFIVRFNPHSAPQLSQREITDKKQGKKNKNRHLKPKKTFKQP